MKSLFLTLLILISFLSNVYCKSNTYYISLTGDDNNTGLSAKKSWKSLDRVNKEVFQPGDVILFKAGEVWKGQLHPQGSGSEGKPITIDRFGEGSLPVINMGEVAGAAVKLTNQEWWVIKNLEVTSGAQPKPLIGRQGIVALAEGQDKHTGHIVIANCFIHDIWGQLGGDGNFTGYNSSGIFIGQAMGRKEVAGGSADDILIENNRIERVDRCGIIIWQGHKNIVVRGNVMENLGGDGIMANGCIKGIIEHNTAKRTCMRSGDQDIVIVGRSYNPHTAAMWIQNCTETLMQFNDVYDTGRQKGNGDGNAYDFDFDCKNCIVQYNYSRNNHGFLLIMYRAFNNIARYNISENDQSHLIQMQGKIADGNLIYNNVFYVDYGTIDIDYYMGGGQISDSAKCLLGANFKNNIFYASGQGRFRTAYTYGSALERQYNDKVKLTQQKPGTLFLHNWYFGPWKNGLPDDPEKAEGDPMFVAPGSGGVGIGTLGGYKLLKGSPCINKGLMIPSNGGVDFYGNHLIPDVADYGAINFEDYKGLTGSTKL